MRKATITNTDPLTVQLDKSEETVPVAFSSVKAESLSVNDEVTVEVIDRRVFLITKEDTIGEPSDESVEFRHLDSSFWDTLEEAEGQVRLAQASIFDPDQMSDEFIQAQHIDVNSLAASEAVIFDLTAQNAVIAGDLWVQSMQAHEIDADYITAGTLDANEVTIDNLTVSMADVTGTLSADRIDGGTITGVTFRTSSSGQRVELSTAEQESIRFYDGNGDIVARIGPIDGTFSDALTLGTDGYLRVRNASDSSFAHIDCGSLTANGGNISGEDISGTSGIFTTSLQVGTSSVSLEGHSHNYASTNHDNSAHSEAFWYSGSTLGRGFESDISTVQYAEQSAGHGSSPTRWATISHVHASGDFEPASSSLDHKTDIGGPGNFDAVEMVKEIEPITFRYDQVEGKILPEDPEGSVRLGVDVEQVPWPLRDPSRDDCLYGHGYSTLLAMAVQQLSGRMEDLEEQISSLKGELNAN